MRNKYKGFPTKCSPHLNSRTNGMQISKGCFLAPSSLSASSNSSPKVARLRATFFDTFSAKMGHFLGHFLPKNPHRARCKGFQRWARFAQALRAFALLVLSGSNRRAGGPEGPCFRIGAGGRKRAFGPVRSYTEMPRFSARHLLAIA